MKRELELLRIAIVHVFWRNNANLHNISYDNANIFLNNISYHNANTSHKRSEFSKHEIKMVDATVRDGAQGYYFNINSIAPDSQSTSYYFIIHFIHDFTLQNQYQLVYS